MKRKAIAALLLAAIMAFSSVSVWALDYAVSEDATTVTARFFLMDEEADDEFAMVSEDGELVINITADTLIYFEDFVPVDDESDEMTQMVREVLFGRTLAEVLEGRNMRVIFEADEENDDIVPVSIMVLFEVAVHLSEAADLENGYEEAAYDYADTEASEVELEAAEALEVEDFDPIVLNGEIVVNNEILAGARLPFWQETAGRDVAMVPLRAVAEALGYDVTWNGYTRSVQLGVGVHIWIGNTEAHVGRMAPIELSTAPVIVYDLTFVPLDFFRDVLGQTVYVFEGQVVIETYSDMQ